MYNIARIVDVKPPYVDAIRKVYRQRNTKPQIGKAGNDASFRVTIDAQVGSMASKVPT